MSALEEAICADCPATFQRIATAQSPARRCPKCVRARKARQRRDVRAGRITDAEDFPVPDVASLVTRYRIAIEIAASGIAVGRYDDARDALLAALGPVRDEAA